MVHILTHNDLDGYAAGYVVLKHFGEENCDIQHYNYDRDVDMSNFKEGDTIVITDYSLSNDEYRKILDIVGDDGHLIWCDHHISAINRYNEDEDLCCEGLRSTKFCGAALAYFYFNTAIDAEDLETLNEDTLTQMLPYLLQLVDAWDCWKLNSPIRKQAEQFNMSIANNLSILELEILDNNPDFIDSYITLGSHYEEFRDSWAEHFRDKYMFKRTLSGWLFGVERDVEVAVLNIGCASSKYFGDIINDVDVCITQCFNGSQWNVSFYSSKADINCSFAASIFGGGGHRGAAGCTFNQQQPPISVGNTEIFRKGENLKWQNSKMKMEKN